MKPVYRNHAGFTLIELMVAIVIVGILMGIVLGISGVANRKSADAKARAEIQTISQGLEEYRLEYGVYPTKISDLTNKLTRIDTVLKDGIKTADPWGREYLYTDVTKYSYRLRSQGQRTDTAADDITSGAP